MATSYPLHRIKVVLLEDIHQRAVELLEQGGFTVEHHTSAYNGQDLIDVARDAHIVGIRSKTHVTEEFLAAADRLWAVGCYCIGTNQVDLAQAAARGVPIFNAPLSNTRSVAEKTLAEVIMLHRKLGDRNTQMHQGVWQKSAVGSHEIRGRTLGIVGYGRIGSQVSVLAELLGMRVLYYDVAEVLTLGNSQSVMSLDQILAESDVVTLHVPATDATKGMIGAEQLAAMKPGAFLINNARGTVVDVQALADAIHSGHIGGAAVDVFPSEPAVNGDDFNSPLCGCPNVILTPHVGGSTIEAQRNIAESVSGRLVKLMNNGSTTTAVNIPEVQLPRLHPGCHRVLHFHRNVPGVLGRLHSAIAEFDVNIVAQYLQTDAHHAYAILDIETPYGGDKDKDAELKAALRTPETIRVRTIW